MDIESLNSLASSIVRDGQQQLGLARRLPAGDTHTVEAIFGVRRLDACRRVGVPWRAQVKEASFTDAECAALMHGENEWTEGVSPLENAEQWIALLDAGVVAAKMERDGEGGFTVSVRAHEQTPAEQAELAEQIEALVAAETAGGRTCASGGAWPGR